MIGRWPWAGAAILLLAGLASCSAESLLIRDVRSAPRGSTERAWNLTPPRGKALVYIVRPGNETPVKTRVACDGLELGTNGRRRFLYAFVDPGSHVFSSRAEGVTELPIALEAGRTYFIEQQLRPSILGIRSKLVRVEDGEGRAKLLKCSLSAKTAAELAQEPSAD